MTLNITIATDKYIVAASDKRLTTALGGDIITERSVKLTSFTCANAKGFIVYSGIGRDHVRKTPSDWLLEDELLPKLQFEELVKRIRMIGDQRLTMIPASFMTKRHTFVVAAFVEPCHYFAPVPAMAVISNFEYGGKLREQADPILSIDWYTVPVNKWYSSSTCVIITGDTTSITKHGIDLFIRKIKDVVTPEKAGQETIKFIRRAAYSTNRKGSIGSAVNYAILEVGKPVIFSESVVGGTTLHGGINIIAPPIKVSDMYMHGGEDGLEFLGCNPVTKRANIVERWCPSCRNPVPLGHKECGQCGFKIKKHKGPT